jgi:CheY-like chemotaxis protein
MFLDIRMPGKSGIEVMRELGEAPPFPVVAMTGNVDRDSVDEYRCPPILPKYREPYAVLNVFVVDSQNCGLQWLPR